MNLSHVLEAITYDVTWVNIEKDGETVVRAAAEIGALAFEFGLDDESAWATSGEDNLRFDDEYELAMWVEHLIRNRLIGPAIACLRAREPELTVEMLELERKMLTQSVDRNRRLFEDLRRTHLELVFEYRELKAKS